MRKQLTNEFYAAIQMNSTEYDLPSSKQIHASVTGFGAGKAKPRTVEISIQSRSKRGLSYGIIRFLDEDSPIHDSEQYSSCTAFELIEGRRTIATGVII